MSDPKRYLVAIGVILMIALLAQRTWQEPHPAEALRTPPGSAAELGAQLRACGAVEAGVERPGWFAADLAGSFALLFEARADLGDTAKPERVMRERVGICEVGEPAGESCVAFDGHLFFSLPVGPFGSTEEALITEHTDGRFEAIPLPIEVLNGRCTDSAAKRTLSHGGETLELWTVWHELPVLLCDEEDGEEAEDGEEPWCSEGCELSERRDVLLHGAPTAGPLTTWTWTRALDPEDVDPIPGCLGIEGNGRVER